MEFFKIFRNFVQSIRFAVRWKLAICQFRCHAAAPDSAADGSTTSDWPWLRMHILRRDHYRCLSCRREGDEVTLLVCQNPIALNNRKLITLCPRCYRIAEHAEIAGDQVAASFHSPRHQPRPAYRSAVRFDGTVSGAKGSLLEGYAQRVQASDGRRRCKATFALLAR